MQYGHCMLKFVFVIIITLRNVFIIIDVTLVWNNIGWRIYDDSNTTEKNAFWQNTDIVEVKYSTIHATTLSFDRNYCISLISR